MANCFKKGDRVRGLPSADKNYGVTKAGWEGIVTKTYGDNSFYADNAPGHTRIVGAFLSNKDFILVTPAAKPVAGGSKSAKTDGPEKMYMEDVQVCIDKGGDYYDMNTEDYKGQFGTIVRYLEYDGMSCSWVMEMRMSDGEILEVLECEIEGYQKLKSKSYKAPIPISISSPSYAPPAPIYTPPAPKYEPVYKQPAPSKPIGTPAVPSGGGFNNRIQPFNLAPKPKKKINMFS